MIVFHSESCYNTGMLTVTLDDFQHNLTEYLHCIKAGETFIIVDANKPVAEIKPIISNQNELRPYALCRGEFQIPDDFDTPLPDEILAQFESS